MKNLGQLTPHSYLALRRAPAYLVDVIIWCALVAVVFYLIAGSPFGLVSTSMSTGVTANFEDGISTWIEQTRHEAPLTCSEEKAFTELTLGARRQSGASGPSDKGIHTSLGWFFTGKGCGEPADLLARFVLADDSISGNWPVATADDLIALGPVEIHFEFRIAAAA